MDHTEEHILNNYMKFKTYDEFIEANIDNGDGWEGYHPGVKTLSEYLFGTYESHGLPCFVKCMFIADVEIYGEEAVMSGVRKLLTYDFKMDYECVGEDSTIYYYCECAGIPFNSANLDKYIVDYLDDVVGNTILEMFEKTIEHN